MKYTIIILNPDKKTEPKTTDILEYRNIGFKLYKHIYPNFHKIYNHNSELKIEKLGPKP